MNHILWGNSWQTRCEACHQPIMRPTAAIPLPFLFPEKRLGCQLGWGWLRAVDQRSSPRYFPWPATISLRTVASHQPIMRPIEAIPSPFLFPEKRLRMGAEVNNSPKKSIYAQTLKMALHKNPAMYACWIVLFMHESNNLQNPKMNPKISHRQFLYHFSLVARIENSQLIRLTEA